LLLEFSHVLQDEDVHKRLNTLASLHLSDWLKKKLKSGSWSSRMNALYVIEDLKLFHLLEEVKKIQKKRNLTKDEAAQILKILAVSNDSDFLPALANSRMNYSDFTVLSILKNCSADQIFACCRVYSDLPASIKYNLITLLGDLQLFEQRCLIERLLQSGDSEEKLRALKAVSDMSLPVQPDLLASFLHSPNWLERMMVLKVIGSLRAEIYQDDAKKLLGDKEYSVRLEAARALLSFKNGKQLLEEVIQFSEDLFARDMALEWISKGGSRK
jgi:HEAT repeat protein